MRPQTLPLKRRLSQTQILAEKISLLKDSYQGEECFILTAGPSLNDYPQEYLREKLKDKLVIAVKQAVKLFPEIVDFHLLNQYNFQRYVTNNATITAMVRFRGSRAKTPGLQEDLPFYIDPSLAITEASLAITKNYAAHTIEQTLERPFGPGIMHELGIYLPVLLGVKTVNVIGWDIGQPNTNEIKRFYEGECLLKRVQRYVMHFSPNLYNSVYIKWENRLKLLAFLLGRDVVINNPGIVPNEAKFIAASTGELYRWYREIGINMNVISTRSMIDSVVPRRTF